jgi:hypothetical protein
MRIRSGNECSGIFVFVKLDLRNCSGNSCMGILIFVNLDLRIRSGNSCMGIFRFCKIRSENSFWAFSFL